MFGNKKMKKNSWMMTNGRSEIKGIPDRQTNQSSEKVNLWLKKSTVYHIYEEDKKDQMIYMA